MSLSFDVSALKGYLSLLSSKDPSIQDLGVSSLRSLVSQFNLNGTLTDLENCINSATKNEGPISNIIGYISKHISRTQITEIWHNQCSRLIDIESPLVKIGNSGDCVLKVQSNCEVILEYINFKGLTVQEAYRAAPLCKFLITRSCRVFKYQIFEIPNMTIEICDCQNPDYITTKVSNTIKVFRHKDQIADRTDFRIKFLNKKNNWYLKGKYYKYIHNTYTASRQLPSPKIFLPIEVDTSSRHELFIINEQFTILL
jgi:hypothetical protein